MSVNLTYAFWRLTEALRPMATRTESLRDRLGRAFRAGMLGLSRDELPEDLQESSGSIWDRLVETDRKPLAEQEAQEIAQKLFDLYVVVSQRLFATA